MFFEDSVRKCTDVSVHVNVQKIAKSSSPATRAVFMDLRGSHAKIVHFGRHLFPTLIVASSSTNHTSPFASCVAPRMEIQIISDYRVLR